MNNPKVYLDNCCYNRPFDDLSRESIRKEADAKLYDRTLCSEPQNGQGKNSESD